MQKYTTTRDGDLEPNDSGECYLASDVDDWIKKMMLDTEESNIQALHTRIAELEKALRPFAQAAVAGAEEMQATATKVRGNPVDGTGAYIWQASRSLCVRDFLDAKRALMGSES